MPEDAFNKWVTSVEKRLRDLDLMTRELFAAVVFLSAERTVAALGEKAMELSREELAERITENVGEFLVRFHAFDIADKISDFVDEYLEEHYNKPPFPGQSDGSGSSFSA